MATYIGIKYRQATGSEHVAFVCPADHIRKWGGVPHKTADFVGGFQRPLSDRYKHIIDFFDEAGNSSPTAIVVAFRPNAVKLTSVNAAELDFSLPSGELVKIEISELAKQSIQDLAKNVFVTFSKRLSEDVQEREADEKIDDSSDSQQEDQIESEILTDDEKQEDWGIDVGNSALAEFVNRLSSDSALNDLLSDLALRIQARDGSSIEDARVAADSELTDVLQSLLKPAMIVDGQHRVWGASECTHEIPFTVVGIVDADWNEQVFQFVVINRQARAITAEFLASIVNSSLTNREIIKLEDRLEAAGLSTYESKMLRLMNDDPESPFNGMISRGLESESNKITFKAAMAIASRWSKKMNDRDDAYKVLFRNGLAGSSNKEKRDSWEAAWKEYMFAFWHGVKNIYEKEQLWEPGTRLMYRATLQVLQEAFLEAKAVAGQSYSGPVKLREDVTEFYKNVPAGFFHAEWKRKELLTSDGQAVLRRALNAARIPGSKLKSIISNQALFTGQSSKN